MVSLVVFVPAEILCKGDWILQYRYFSVAVIIFSFGVTKRQIAHSGSGQWASQNLGSSRAGGNDFRKILLLHTWGQFFPLSPSFFVPPFLPFLIHSSNIYWASSMHQLGHTDKQDRRSPHISCTGAEKLHSVIYLFNKHPCGTWYLSFCSRHWEYRGEQQRYCLRLCTGKNLGGERCQTKKFGK